MEQAPVYALDFDTTVSLHSVSEHFQEIVRYEEKKQEGRGRERREGEAKVRKEKREEGYRVTNSLAHSFIRVANTHSLSVFCAPGNG